MDTTTNSSRKIFLGFLSHRPRWGLTWRGRIFVFLLLLIVGVRGVLQIHPFLAMTKPVETRVMVVEGWISVPSIEMAAKTFQDGDYEMLLTVGGPFRESVSTDRLNYAQVTANQFIELGIAEEKVHPVPSGSPRRDRTYTSAATLRDWLEENGIAVSTLNVMTEGLHARRSRLMFQKAFGKDVSIGVISIPDLNYEPNRWWRYSEGFKGVISEGAAYIYARFLFDPPRSKPKNDEILAGS